jgi:trans-aconitate methyltransferase
VTLPESYFDDLYAASPDPWGFASRWYEQRKRALTLALLPAPRYASAFEPGCSIGVLTRELATRCDDLLATDVSAAAVHATRARCADLPHVRVEQGGLPVGWPPDVPDLVVLSEVAYYLEAHEAREVARRAARSDTVLAVHWRHHVADYPLGGDEVHKMLGEAAADDLISDVWSRDARSVATRGGLS